MKLHKYYVYILTNKSKTVLYIGVTNDLNHRIDQHKTDIEIGNNTFVAKYKCKYLLYYEEHQWIQKAIEREKEIKGWRREKKIELIKQMNPDLEFLNE